MTKVPVALIFFRRRCVLEVLQRIRDYAPSQLFLIADGGRTPEEHAQCQEVRQLVEAAIDWPCRIDRLYSDRNLGCRGNIPRGITWAFSQVDRAAILEDDTIPHPDFFTFCGEMLERYLDEPRIMTVAGTNFLSHHDCFKKYSYTFSAYATTWGYATWARAWRYYDVDIPLWPAVEESGLLQSIFADPREHEYWAGVFGDVWAKTCSYDPYDFQWVFASFLHSGLCIVPGVNLVTNVGTGPESTHFQKKTFKYKLFNRASESLVVPLVHPPVIVRNMAFDQIHGPYAIFGEPPTGRQVIRAAIVSRLPPAIRNALRGIKRVLRG